MSSFGTGKILSSLDELWILSNSGKNVVDSTPQGSERIITNIVEDDGSVKVEHDD